MFFQKIRKLTTGFILSVIIFSSLAGFVLSVEPVAAVPTEVIADVPAQADSIFTLIKNGWKIAVLNAAQQAVSYFLRKVAYDSAVWMASGGKGQSPFANTKGFGDYMASVGSEAAGTAIEQLGKGFGLDLCKIPDVKLDLALRIGLHYNFATGNEPRKPACNLETFQANWSGDAWASKYGDGQGGFDVNKVFNKSLSVDDAPLGIAYKTTEKIDRLVAKQSDAAKADRVEGQGFKAATKLVSGDVKTPSQVVKKEVEANAPSEQNKKSEAQIAAAMGSGAYEIIPSTLSLFLNTLSGQMLKNFKENGMLPGGLCIGGFGDPSCKNSGGSQAQNFDAGAPAGGRIAAEAAFSEFLTTKLDTLSNYDILAELNSCESRGLYNCRADQGLVQAIQEAKQGEPVTIKEAIDKGWLHGNWKLIPPSRIADNADRNCYNNNYCYSNLQVLRQLRIFPLGVEIAAKNSDPDHPATLNDVVSGFYDCNYVKDTNGNVVGVNYDPENKPFCHLVDPNWVIKLSQTRCDAMAYGPTPLSTDVPDRIKECVDLKTCVGKDKDGNCAGYGNCVREKNVWKFDATKCDAQYASCRSFTNSTGKSVSYLYRSLDTGDCSQSTAGCTAYSLEQDNAGKWKTVDKTTYGNYSTGVYLNKNVSTACSASAAGCSAFKIAGDTNTNNIVPLKKAPDYLHCYDVDANQSNGTQWPQTFSDIFKLQPNPECKNFAQVCIADEVGCANYQLAGDPQASKIPGKFTPATVTNNTVENWNDQCDGKCAGYSAYREMSSNYSSGMPLAYIIPPSKYNNNQSGAVCTAQEVGCSSFTNMATTEGGGEKVEYFTDLRACIKPDVNKQKNFYTYEGSIAAGGYQLQAYILEQVDGAPATIFVNAQTKVDAATYKCNATLYKAGQADGDCRQFNDDKGIIYYALLSHTVVVSPDCTPYRLNSTELAGSGQCFNNGEYKDGACYYNGLPTGVATNAGSSKICSAAAVSCREYKGNNSNNTKTILTEIFENQSSVSATNGWSSSVGTVAWSSESTHVGEHSLGYTGNTNGVVKKTLSLKPDALDLQNNMSYSLSFWAKGSGANVEVSMTDGSQSTVVAGTITANTSWQYFTFNLVELQSSGTSSINFKLKTSGNLFLDNIRLTKVSEFLYLVKDSLKVDPICDDNQTDNLPGAALGCSAYAGPKNTLGDNLYFLTNFSFLCRDGAIGCTALTDTFNKKDKEALTYNVSLVGAPGAKVTAVVGGKSYSCQIEQGKTSCYVNMKGHTKSEIEAATGATAQFVNSTYYIPADTSNTAPVYLVADQAASCGAVDLGCTVAGLQKSTPIGNQFETVAIKLDPSQFEAGTDASGNTSPGILCHQQALGCGVYGSSLGEAYFKDPAITGSKICTYQTNIIKDNNKVSGWFWKDVGVCGNTTTLQVGVEKTICSNDSDCTAGSGCIEKDIQACYPDYLQNGNNYGLWSFGNKDKYKNFVGECPAQQNTCTEFVDRNDNDTAYYFLKNNKITEGDCGGVSQKSGCAMFDQTDNPNKFWNTAATYVLSDTYLPGKNSDLSKVTKVQPIDLKEKNDANIIIKVKRDRECAEWLQCASSHSVFDDVAGKWKSVCDAVGVCSQSNISNDANDISVNNCEKFVDTSDSAGKVLTEQDYAQRDITWEGKDWAGYSILGKFIANEFSQVNVGTDAKPVWTLAKKIDCGGVNCLANSADNTSCILAKLPVPCGKSSTGTCINGVCLQNLNGTPIKSIDLETVSQNCRAYPEKDSPFPNSVTIKKSNEFISTNRCSEGENGTQANLCECDYSKVSYGESNSKRYFDFTHVTDNTTKGVCVGGENDGKFCSDKLQCPDPGDCQIHKKDTQIVGWRGYCLEEDLSRTLFGDKEMHPCLSWFPIDTLSGARDINYQHKEAGFEAQIGGTYCYKANLFARPFVGASCGASGCTCPSGYSLAPTDSKACLADFSIPYNNIPKNNVFGFGEYNAKPAKYQISCEQPAVIDSNLVAVTDNAWKKGVSVAGNYFATPNVPYAVGNSGIYKANLFGAELTKGLIQLPWCQYGPFKYRKPYSDPSTGEFSCDPSFTLSGGTNGGGYNAWAFRYGLEGSDSNVSKYAGFCQNNGDCKADGQQTAKSPNAGFCAFPCDPDSKDSNQCGTGGSCVPFNGEYICSQKSGTFFDYSSMTSDEAEKTKHENEDPCVMFNQIENLLPGIPPNNNDAFIFTGGGKSVEYANQICANSSGLHCILSAGLSQSVCSDSNYPTTCKYGITSARSCIDDNGKIVKFTTTTIRLEKEPNTEICGDKNAPPPTCEKRFIGTTNPGESFGLDMSINICSNIPTPKFVVAESSFTNTGESLKQLLASVSTIYSWKYNSVSKQSGYEKGIWAWNSTFDLTGAQGKAGVASNPPVIHPVSDQCKTGEKCLEVNEDGVTVNNVWNKDVFVQSNSQRVFMKFYAWADKNHMPLRAMRVDWNDGSDAVIISDAYIRNNKGSYNTTCEKAGADNSKWTCKGANGEKCSTDKDCQFLNKCIEESSNPKDFGSIAFKTCDNSYFAFEHTYACDSKNTQKYVPPVGNNPGQGGWADTCPDSKNFPGGCCVFKPRVQVKDNWGWCNGTCPGGPGGDKCYDDNKTGDSGVNECDDFKSNQATTKFKGNILVAPNK